MSELRRNTRLAVVGGNRPEKRFLETAYEVGRAVAEAGAVLVCGGLGGVMEAASRGAKEAGGITVGILPGGDPAAANRYIDLPVVTGLGYTRNSLVVMNADAVIAVDGEYGTLSEIAFSLIYGRKVIGIGTWDIPGVIPAPGPREAVEMALKDIKER
jgi:hypothetical protein